MSAITTVQFDNTNLEIIDRNGQQWLQAPQIAEALGYKELQSVSRIFRRNSDEFTKDMTDTVKLTLSGNLETTQRIFSPRGAHLIAMFARTDKAKAFRKWVLDVLDSVLPNAEPQTNQVIERISPEQKGELQQIMSARCAQVPADMQGKARSSLWGQLNKINGVNSYHDTKASQFEESKRLLESLTILKGVVVEQPAIEQPKTQTIPEDMTMIKRHKIESALIAIDSAAARCDGIHEVERLFAIAEEAQTKAIKALNDYRRDAVDAIHTAAYHARHISAQIN